MKVGIRTAAVAAALALFAAGCADSSSTPYSAADVGQIIETAEGTVVSSQIVDIKGGKDPGYGGAGGTGGSMGGGSSGNITLSGGGPLGAVMALLIGGGAAMGYLGSDLARDEEGIEYMVRMDDGRIITLVQEREGEEPPIENGTPVLVQYGSEFTRIVPDPTALKGTEILEVGPGGTWKNPDDLPAQPPPGSDKGGPSVPDPDSPAIQ